MKVVIDTNSLLSLVRYYLPFDTSGALYEFFKRKILQCEIVIIDKVYDQCSYIAKGIILSRLDFLSDVDFRKSAKLPYSTSALLPPSPGKFLNLMESNFPVAVQKKKLTDVEFENQKNRHMEDADIKQVILCLHLMRHGEEVILVTEETAGSNDNKLFKKIPTMCEILGIATLPLPELIKKYEEIKFTFDQRSS